MLLAACGSGGAPTAATTSGPSGVGSTTTAPSATGTRARASAGGLTVTLSGSSGRAARGAAVQFTAEAVEARARGALAYRVTYGDGTSDQNVVPQFCLAGSGSAQSQTWSFTRRYETAGSYQVSVAVTANCTSDSATAAVSIAIS